MLSVTLKRLSSGLNCEVAKKSSFNQKENEKCEPKFKWAGEVLPLVTELCVEIRYKGWIILEHEAIESWINDNASEFCDLHNWRSLKTIEYDVFVDKIVIKSGLITFFKNLFEKDKSKVISSYSNMQWSVFMPIYSSKI